MDDFIGTHHTQALHDAYGGPKEIIVAEGDHNTLRSAKSLLAIGSFLKKELAPDSTRDAGEAVDALEVCRGGGAGRSETWVTVPMRWMLYEVRSMAR